MNSIAAVKFMVDLLALATSFMAASESLPSRKRLSSAPKVSTRSPSAMSWSGQNLHKTGVGGYVVNPCTSDSNNPPNRVSLLTLQDASVVQR